MNRDKKSTIVTIGRTYGSGGGEIGKKVAAELKIPFYDKELLEMAAKESGICVEDLKKYDEERISTFIFTAAFSPYPSDTTPIEIAARDLQVKTIRTLASEGPCVIVGRRADRILCEEFDVISVFVSAPLENRIARVSRREGMSEKDSRKKIAKIDRHRRAFYDDEMGSSWGDASNYNLCINSGKLSVESAAALIVQYVKLEGKLV